MRNQYEVSKNKASASVRFAAYILQFAYFAAGTGRLLSKVLAV